MDRLILAVVGSRTFTDYDKMKSILDILKPSSIISGGAVGADTLAERYAKENGVNILVYTANWELHGKSAGAIRNRIIVENCDQLIAFWDKKSRGTKMAIEMAKEKGKLLVVIEF
jgi:hypothetical protein